MEVYRRNAEGRFELYEFRADDTVELASVGVSLAVGRHLRQPSRGIAASVARAIRTCG